MSANENNTSVHNENNTTVNFEENIKEALRGGQEVVESSRERIEKASNTFDFLVVASTFPPTPLLNKLYNLTSKKFKSLQIR
ncbi:hypothetical protein ACOQXD_001854 [Campylobacter jejuni]